MNEWIGIPSRCGQALDPYACSVFLRNIHANCPTACWSRKLWWNPESPRTNDFPCDSVTELIRVFSIWMNHNMKEDKNYMFLYRSYRTGACWIFKNLGIIYWVRSRSIILASQQRYCRYPLASVVHEYNKMFFFRDRRSSWLTDWSVQFAPLIMNG